jgi:hypothetical protein
MKTDPVRYLGSRLPTPYVMQFIEELAEIAGKREQDFLFIEPYSIGDTVHTLGLLPRFREVYCEPGQRIILLCQERAAGLSAIMPFADVVVGHKLSPQLDLQLEYVASLSNGFLNPQLPIVCAPYMHAFGTVGRLVVTTGPLAFKRSILFLKHHDPWQAPVVSEAIRAPMEQRLAALGLEQGRGLIVFPRGHTLKDLDPAFWEAAVRALKSRFPHLRVFTETGRNPPIEGTEPLRLSLAELIPAVEYAGAALALRSGIVDILAYAQADIVSLVPPPAFYAHVPTGFLQEDLFVGGWLPGSTVSDLALTGMGWEAAEAVARAFRGGACT